MLFHLCIFRVEFSRILLDYSLWRMPLLAAARKGGLCASENTFSAPPFPERRTMPKYNQVRTHETKLSNTAPDEASNSTLNLKWYFGADAAVGFSIVFLALHLVFQSEQSDALLLDQGRIDILLWKSHHCWRIRRNDAVPFERSGSSLAASKSHARATCPLHFDPRFLLVPPGRVANPSERKNAPSSVKKMPQMGFLLHKDFWKNARYKKIWHLFVLYCIFINKGKCPMVEKMLFFSEKGIKNVRSTTLPTGPPLPPSLWCTAGPIVLGIPHPRPRGMGRRGADRGQIPQQQQNWKWREKGTIMRLASHHKQTAWNWLLPNYFAKDTLSKV